MDGVSLSSSANASSALSPASGPAPRPVAPPPELQGAKATLASQTQPAIPSAERSLPRAQEVNPQAPRGSYINIDA